MPKNTARSRTLPFPSTYEGPLGPTREFRVPLPIKLAAEFIRYADSVGQPVDLLIAEAMQDYAAVVIAARLGLAVAA